MTCLASKPHKSNGHMTCLVYGTPSNNGHYSMCDICLWYVLCCIMNFMYMVYVLGFPCWALGSLLYVYMCRKIALVAGKVLGSLGMCIEARLNRWTERSIRGWSLFNYGFICIFRTLLCNPFYLQLCYVFLLKQWDPISYFKFYVV